MGIDVNQLEGFLFHNLNGCLIPEGRNGNQAHHTPGAFSGLVVTTIEMAAGQLL